MMSHVHFAAYLPWLQCSLDLSRTSDGTSDNAAAIQNERLRVVVY